MLLDDAEVAELGLEAVDAGRGGGVRASLTAAAPSADGDLGNATPLPTI